MMHDGQILLGEFVERGSQAAFGQIVSVGHLKRWCTSPSRSALRSGETTLAEDAAQAVIDCCWRARRT